MTRDDKERMLYSLYCDADEAIKSIQQCATALKNPEDNVKNMVTLLKIQDRIADMRKVYDEVDRIQNEPIDEFDENDEYGSGMGYVDEFTQNLLNPMG